MDDILRIRQHDLAMNQAMSQPGIEQVGGNSAFCALTKTITTYPTTAGVFYACQTASVTGTEVEGGAGTVTGLGDTFFALNLGGSIPPSGAKIKVTRVPHRYVFRYDS